MKNLLIVFITLLFANLTFASDEKPGRFTHKDLLKFDVCNAAS